MFWVLTVMWGFRCFYISDCVAGQVVPMPDSWEWWQDIPLKRWEPLAQQCIMSQKTGTLQVRNVAASSSSSSSSPSLLPFLCQNNLFLGITYATNCGMNFKMMFSLWWSHEYWHIHLVKFAHSWIRSVCSLALCQANHLVTL